MIRVGFFLPDKGWSGGINYMKNLFFAIQSQENRKIQPVLILSKKDSDYGKMYQNYAEIVYSEILNKKSVLGLIFNVEKHFLKTNLLLNYLIRKHKIDLLSHSGIASEGVVCKVINWIPDFQHLHLLDIFSVRERKKRDTYYQNLIVNSDLLVLSSQDAKKDCMQFMPEFEHKYRVLNFVSQVHALLLDNKANDALETYGIRQPFFYLPNQFWKHKNHIVAFKAVKHLSDQGVDILLVCTGAMKDFRGDDHLNQLKEFITENKLEEKILLLGKIDYQDVLFLMKNARAVINPSYFEGWSSTVEECKSIGQTILLSDISIHREQNPEKGHFFEQNDHEGLAEILQNLLQTKAASECYDVDEISAKMKERTQKFGETYQNIVMELTS